MTGLQTYGGMEMKRIKLTVLATDGVRREQFGVLSGVAEIEKYEEKPIPKEADVFAEHSFESLLDGGKDIAQGIWMVIKGIGATAKWSVVIIIGGFKWLWSNGVGKEKEKKAKKQERGGA